MTREEYYGLIVLILILVISIGVPIGGLLWQLFHGGVR